MNRKADITSANSIPFTDKIKNRIKTLQKENGYTDADVASILNLTLHKYKNLANGKHKNIQLPLAEKIATIYDCTCDYLIGESDERNTDRYGVIRSRPVSFKEVNQKLAEVTEFLHKDYTTLKNIHLFLIQMPPDARDNMLAALNSLSQLVRITALTDRKDSLSEEKLSYIVDNLQSDSEQLTIMNVKLSEADRHLSIKRRKAALLKYLEIILYASIQSAPAAKKAVLTITTMQKEWGNFPAKLNPLIQMLPQMQKINFSNYPSKAENIILSYFSSHNIEMMSRDEYFLSFKEN